MIDPRYRTSVGADGARYIHFFGEQSRVAIVLETDGTGCLLFAGKMVTGHDPVGVDLTDPELAFCQKLWDALVRVGGPMFVDGPATPPISEEKKP